MQSRGQIEALSPSDRSPLGGGATIDETSLKLYERPMVPPTLEEDPEKVACPTPRSSAPRRPRLPRVIWVALGVQWLVLCYWTWWVYDTWNVHVDFASRSQAVYGILHNNWNPFYTIMGWSHLGDHFDLSMYPLAFLTLAWPHLMWIFIVQVSLLLGAEVGALLVLDHFATQAWWPPSVRRGTSMGLLTFLFLCNPFLFWGVSVDPHFHVFGAVCGCTFVLLYFLRANYRRMGASVAFTLLFGDLSAQLLIALGISLLLASLFSKRQRGAAVAIIASGAIWWTAAGALGSGPGNELSLHYGYLTGAYRGPTTLGQIVQGVVSHPTVPAERLWTSLQSMWGSLSVGGLVGMFTPLSLPALLNSVEAGLGVQVWVGWPYQSLGSMAEMPWQMLPTLVFEPLFTIVAIAWLHRGSGRFGLFVRRATPLMFALIAINAAIWSLVWIPQVIRSTNLNPPSEVAALNQITQHIPPQNEVVTSLGDVGRMGDREFVYLTVFRSANTVIPLRTSTVDFLITPTTGQESNGVDLEALTSYLLQLPNARLVQRMANIWLFTVHPLPGQHQLVMHYNSNNVVGAALPTFQSNMRFNWPARNCMWSASSASGYVFSDYRNSLAPGQWVLRLVVDGTSKMLVTIGDASSHQLLTRSFLRPIAGLHTVVVTFNVTQSGLVPDSYGWGPYRLTFPSPQIDDSIEVRLWASGGGRRSVCSASIAPLL